jgi:hypothetical protein
VFWHHISPSARIGTHGSAVWRSALLVIILSFVPQCIASRGLKEAKNSARVGDGFVPQNSNVGSGSFASFKLVGPISHRCQEGSYWTLTGRDGADFEWCYFVSFGLWEISQKWASDPSGRATLEFDHESGRGDLLVADGLPALPVSFSKQGPGAWSLTVGGAGLDGSAQVGGLRSQLTIHAKVTQRAEPFTAGDGLVPFSVKLRGSEIETAWFLYERRSLGLLQLQRVEISPQSLKDFSMQPAFWLAVVLLAQIRAETESALFDDLINEFIDK